MHHIWSSNLILYNYTLVGPNMLYRKMSLKTVFFWFLIKYSFKKFSFTEQHGADFVLDKNINLKKKNPGLFGT